MEDCNMLAADCIVISSCCPCLVIQILVFFLLRLPYRLAKKTKKFLLKKLHRRLKKIGRERRRCIGRADFLKVQVQISGVLDSDWHHDHQSRPIEAAERVMVELYECGELGFGFFGRGNGENDLTQLPDFASCVWEIHECRHLTNLEGFGEGIG